MAEPRARRPAAALEGLERRGRLTTADNAELLRDVMVADWFEARSEGEATLMLAARREVVADINRRARELLMEHNQLGAEVMTVEEHSFAMAMTCCSRPGSSCSSPPWPSPGAAPSSGPS